MWNQVQGYRLPLFGRTTGRKGTRGRDPAYALAGWELSGVNREAGAVAPGARAATALNWKAPSVLRTLMNHPCLS